MPQGSALQSQGPVVDIAKKLILPVGAATFTAFAFRSTIAVWSRGGVGQMAIASAWILGAKRVIAIDRVPERLAMAKTRAGPKS
ncbi:MAG: alanine acetyltransferase [Bryobacterales bacterium]|jgi:threonine dehydrogenase-like Zn-dependent dehydrogenase|nr:alanine acetyltransferase [Bryobacterales bacterium]